MSELPSIPSVAANIKAGNYIEKDLGYNERRFTPSERYSYHELILPDGTRHFSKSVSPEDPKSASFISTLLGREPMWAGFAQKVGKQRPDLDFRALVPEYIEGEDAYATRLVYPYIDAPLLAEPDDSTSLRDPAVLKRYAAILLALDNIGANWQPAVKPDDSLEHTPFNDVGRSWDEWLQQGELIRPGMLSAQMVGKARQLVNDYKITAGRIQHGDFTPWHLFKLVENGIEYWISFDGEHASTAKPRFYDLAYTYSRLFTRSKDPETASRLLETFVNQGVQDGAFDEDELLKSFLPVLMSRSMGMFLDAHFDLIKDIDYRDMAHELFERCQDRNLQTLTGV